MYPSVIQLCCDMELYGSERRYAGRHTGDDNIGTLQRCGLLLAVHAHQWILYSQCCQQRQRS
jgi:hypothetical protein